MPSINSIRFCKNMINKYSAVVFDLSGVLVDFGVHVPVIAIKHAFNNQNININEQVIRENIGKDNINFITALSNFNKCRDKLDTIIDDYEQAVLNLNRMNEFNTPINGTIELTNNLNRLGIKVGIISEYNKKNFSIINKSLKRNGLYYDKVVCADEVIIGKPEPLMLYNVNNKLKVSNQKCLKVGQSYLNVIEGLNAKVDTLNVLDSSVDMGIDELVFDDSNETIKMMRRSTIINKLMDLKSPKFFVTNIGELNKVISKL
jgi:phosphonoacetaldehyde hydrolase